MKGKDDSGIGQSVDVICQHCRDGTIIPMRVRLKDEEGMLQSYTIKGYRKVDGGSIVKTVKHNNYDGRAKRMGKNQR